jgi:hypothetical protein
MEQYENKQEEEKPGLPKTPQTADGETGPTAIPPDKEHTVSSEKNIDLSDEDKALDSGI